MFLASKLEEAKKKIKDVINVFDYIDQIHSGKEFAPMDIISEVEEDLIKLTFRNT